MIVSLLLLGGSLILDQIPLSAARPAKSITTFEEFQAWKQGAITGRGTFETAGLTYTVMLAPPGRYLASGPSAYLFDQQGKFVDWTADIGDFKTVKHGFDLSSGHLKNITLEKP